jgi:hypothetical protein
MLTIKNIVPVFMLVLVAANVSAQQKNSAPLLQFHSINNIGLLEGQAGSAFQLQTINGAQYKSWFGGAGIGLDYYKYRTIPLFFDLRKEFGKSHNKFFVYGDAGIDFYWKRDNDAKQFYYDDKFKNGFYGEAGAGYKLKISQKLSFVFSAGYSYKKMTEEGDYYYMGPTPNIYPQFPSESEKINYHLNRLVLKAGIEF